MYADSGVPKGYPDLTIYVGEGIVCFVECKVGYNKTTVEQNDFNYRMSRFGYLYAVVYTMKEWNAFARTIQETYNL